MAKKLSVTPLHDRVIVKPAKAEEKTAGGMLPLKWVIPCFTVSIPVPRSRSKVTTC